MEPSSSSTSSDRQDGILILSFGSLKNHRLEGKSVVIRTQYGELDYTTGLSRVATEDIPLDWNETIRLPIFAESSPAKHVTISIISRQFIGSSQLAQLQEDMDPFLNRPNQLKIQRRSLASLGAIFEFRSFFVVQNIPQSILEADSLVVQLDSKTFLPGDRINGVLLLKQKKRHCYSQAIIKIYGRTSISWSESRPSSSGRGTSTTTHAAKDVCIRRIIPLPIDSTREGKDLHVDSGVYVWKFHYDLHPDIPPSWSTLNGKCHYSISASLDSRKIFKSKTKTQKFKVLAIERPMPETEFGVLYYDKNTPVDSFELDEGFSPTFIIGGINDLPATIRNFSDTDKQVIEFSMAHGAYYSAQHHTHMKTGTFPLGQYSLGIAPQSQFNHTFHFNIPDTAVPSVPLELSQNARHVARLHVKLMSRSNKLIFHACFTCQLVHFKCNNPILLQRPTNLVPSRLTFRVSDYDKSTGYLEGKMKELANEETVGLDAVLVLGESADIPPTDVAPEQHDGANVASHDDSDGTEKRTKRLKKKRKQKRSETETDTTQEKNCASGAEEK
eukprot:TRINITY_DN1428_c0_g1_i1.p1 TRINITY_DN1428_c0_g1~~TRINITY_DN1428_c0_g1_i1.p1  ORF type:complete len:557 (-),score=79.82 TRINITY_DN1428_c0_g1_i1:890-2560(-)